MTYEVKLAEGQSAPCQLKLDPRTAEIPVVFVTSQSDSTEEEEGLAAGAADFIAKSASANVMRARVNTLITLKRQADLLRSLAQLEENVKATDLVLSAQQVARLDEASRFDLGYPYAFMKDVQGRW